MQKHTKWLIVAGAVVLLLAGIVMMIMRGRSLVSFSKPINVHDKVVYSVKSWAQYPTIPSDDAVLEVVWAETINKHDFRFHPEGAQTLVTQLTNDFSKPPVTKTIIVNTKDFYATTNKGGKIKTVTDLINAVDQSAPPR